MGSLLSKFRKQPTTTDQLKKIEDGLQKIEEYKRSTERKQKKTVANVMLYGVALYILACIIVGVWYLPESWVIRVVLVFPLVLVPVFIYYMRRLISVFFQRKMRLANEEYEDLQRKKKVLIDNVMETETFNKAKEILSKYAPEALEKKERAGASILSKESGGDLRKRTVSTVNSTTTVAKPQLVPAGSQGLGTQRTDLNLRNPSPQRTDLNLPTMELKIAPSVQPIMQLQQPLFSRDRSFTDKLVEYIIGDGPNNRYALICKYCSGHNGMAMKEEFPYMSFACCYCRKLNASKSQRPSPPRLPDPLPLAEPTMVPSLPAPLDVNNKGFIQPVIKHKPEPEFHEEKPSTVYEESDEGKTISEDIEGRNVSEDGERRSISPVPAEETNGLPATSDMTIEQMVDESGDQDTVAGEVEVDASHQDSDQQPPTIKSDINPSSHLESEQHTM